MPFCLAASGRRRDERICSSKAKEEDHPNERIAVLKPQIVVGIEWRITGSWLDPATGHTKSQTPLYWLSDSSTRSQASEQHV